ncbi:hypothetical protein MRS44_017099 [Fusarium solani]|uniref:uncharacterized protein n=1 Tax=Fusarium solani TaxID=169388 RepID=UPI0032C4AE6C|nr:hypothetical protein MRS44_017099 [Fusarium solani]
MLARNANEALQRNRLDDQMEPDACVRRFHIHHPTPESMGVFILNAKNSELCVLRDFFWNHIRGQKNKASIRFTPGNGGRTFSLTYHIPSFVLRTVDLLRDDLPEDCRKRTDRSPWRKSRKLSFLCTDMQPDAQIVDILHKTQHSFTVYGYNKSIWTSNYPIDTYFYKHDPDNPDTVGFYVDDPNDEEDADADAEVWDPSTIGTLEAHKVVLDPCDYFLIVLLERYKQWYEEWMNTFTIIQRRISIYFETHTATMVTVPTSKESARKALTYIEKSRQWLKQTEELLELLTRTLRAIITSWNVFKQDDRVYFPKNRGIWSSHQQIVNKVKELADVLEGFLDLKDRCRHFGKNLELDIGVQSGPVISLQYLNVTFMQVIAPVAVSAAIIQAQILSFGVSMAWFLSLSVGLFALNWHTLSQA